MIVRNNDNKLIIINEKEYNNEKSLYSELWKMKYNKKNLVNIPQYLLLCIIIKNYTYNSVQNLNSQLIFH